MITRSLAVSLAVLAAPISGTARAQSTIVIRGVTVIDGTGAPPRPDAVVAIRDGRIVHLGLASAFRAPREARVIDGRGHWLVPGFIDMHAHIALGPVTGMGRGAPVATLDSTLPSRSLRTLLAHGVTTIRDPGTASTALAVAVRDSVANGRLVGPRVFTAGEVIDASVFPGLVVTARTPQEVRAEVRRQVEVGVDYVKLYASLPPPLVRAGVEEAHAHGKKALVHPFATSWTAAAEAGIDGIVHAVPSSPLLLRPDRRAAFLANFARSTRFMFQWFEYADLSSPELDSMVRAMTAHRVVHDPTLVVFEAMAWGDSARVTEAPELSLAAPSLLANWRADFQLTLGWRPADYDSARAVWPTVLRFVRFLHERGVFLVAGTDANNPWTVPGPSLHRELALLVAAGIPPLDVLRIATRNGAEALGILDEVGTVELGKRADLVLLEADPLTHVGNTRRIAWVMQGGRIHEPAALLRGLR